ncbi:hypothetical protein [Brevundimonas sp.]|uniref:hypothetical protein n=1 Tax=Brevundimonas sp. TaxID=1871086 RepID=UPI002D1FA41E|nr:hypothetical protein [Brevundimonas sp.]
MAVGTAASAQQPLFRSDLPLFTEADEVWPRGFSDGESFGCANIVLHGDYGGRSDREDASDQWWRIANYGVFHCAMIFYEASDRAWLNEADHAYAWLGPLGEAASPDNERLELFALQIGAHGGSRYLFLARLAEGGGNEWRLLDAQCPRGAVRRTRSIDVWRTDYCVIEDISTLRGMARSAAGRPPIDVFTWVGRAPRTEPFLPADVESFARRVRECRDLADLEPTSEDGRRWTEEAAADYGCVTLAEEAATLSARYPDRSEIAALLGALSE